MLGSPKTDVSNIDVFLILYYGLIGIKEDIHLNGVEQGKDRQKLFKIVKDYKIYKDTFGKNIVFDPSFTNLSKQYIIEP